MFPFPFSFIAPTASGLADIDNVYSMEFDGQSYVETGYIYNATVTPNLSISFWYNSTTVGNFLFPISIPTGGGNANYPSAICMVYCGRLLISDRSGWNPGPCSGTLLTSGWNNIIITAAYSGNTTDGTNLNIYLNGNLTPELTSAGMGTGVNSYLNGELRFGAFNPNYVTPGYWSGKLDEIGVWESILTSDDITEIYNATSAGSPAKTADLSTMATPPVAWYRMGD